MSTRPNILFLMSDEHRFDISGFAGNSIIRTPNLDRLAKDGVVFGSAYTPSPICVPARQCILSGQFPRTCGCEVYGDDLTPGYMTYAKRFSQYAYDTVACGKLHLMGSDQLQGFTHIRGCHENIDKRYIEGRIESEFQKYLSLIPRETDNDLPETPSPNKWSDAKEIRRAGIGKPRHNFNDHYAVMGALDYIDRHFVDPYYDKATPNTPLLLKVSLEKPHYPYQCSEAAFRYYLNRVAEYENQTVFPHPFLSQRQVRKGIDASEHEIRRAIAAYYGMIEEMDRLFGTVLDHLEEIGQNLDDWIIIYTSDHGEMLGEHGIWEKQKFFEGSVRVPLIIRYPKLSGGHRTVKENVNLCDLFSTLCELAGLPIPDSLDSRSLVPLMKGDSSHWDNETISQFRGTNLMIKRDHLKYQYYQEDQSELLFDLERDPHENHNFSDEECYQAQLAHFRRRKKELRF